MTDGSTSCRNEFFGKNEIMDSLSKVSTGIIGGALLDSDQGGGVVGCEGDVD